MSEFSSETHQRLSDPTLSFASKLKLAASFELEYWEDRQHPPNISITVFRSMVQLVPESVVPKWRERKSNAGAHGPTGEDVVFNFEFTALPFGKEVRFYCKGYFFDKGNLKGVTIQSFRPMPSAAVIPIRGER
jgi:hypothetical protein